MDYYLFTSPDGLLVEEFEYAEDHSTVGLRGAAWSPGAARWSDAAALSRSLRGDPHLRAGAEVIDRVGAVAAYRRLGGGELPAEAVLRACFDHPLPLATAAPLILNPATVPAGFVSARRYRLLFAGDLRSERLASLPDGWRLTPGDDPRVVGTGRRSVGRDAFAWELRRIGGGGAWGVDVTAHLGDRAGATVGPLLRELAATGRGTGLIPVTVERFA